MVLSAHHRLHALAVFARQVVNVSANRRRADEGDRLDVFVGAHPVDHLFAAVHDVEHARRHAGLDRQFHQQHGRHRVLLGRLEHEGVAAGDGHREHPQRDHRREVERRDAGADADRLTQRVGVNATGNVFGEFAHLQGADGARVLDHFQAAEDIALGVRNGLALFGAEHDGDAFGVFADQRLQLEHDAHTGADRRVPPGGERLLRGGDSGIDLSGRRERHVGQHFLGGGVDHVEPFGGLRLNPFTTDQQLHAGHGGVVFVQ